MLKAKPASNQEQAPAEELLYKQLKLTTKTKQIENGPLNQHPIRNAPKTTKNNVSRSRFEFSLANDSRTHQIRSSTRADQCMENHHDEFHSEFSKGNSLKIRRTN